MLTRFFFIKLEVGTGQWAVNKNMVRQLSTLTMSLNVPDNNEELHDKNIGASSVPLNGVPKVKHIKNTIITASDVAGTKSGWSQYEGCIGQSDFRSEHRMEDRKINYFRIIMK